VICKNLPLSIFPDIDVGVTRLYLLSTNAISDLNNTGILSPVAACEDITGEDELLRLLGKLGIIVVGDECAGISVDVRVRGDHYSFFAVSFYNFS